MGIQIGFAATVMVVAAVIVGMVARGSRRDAAVVGAAIAGWLGITAGLAASGAIAFGDGPPVALALPWIFIIAAIVWLRSQPGRRFVAEVPRTWVVALQSFRIPVELVLWGLFVAGSIPERMTFEGRNFDVLVGLTAVPVALLAGRRGTLVWHVVGLLLLANIVTMAIRAQPPVIPTVPYVWLPAFLVPVAALGHGVGIAISAGRGVRAGSARPAGSDRSTAPR